MTVLNHIEVCHCPLCGEPHEVHVNLDDMGAWLNGTLVQNAFPYLSIQERELLQTGICGPCWDKSFGEDE